MRLLSAHQVVLKAKELARSIRAMQNSMRGERSAARREQILESMVHETKMLQRLLETQVG